MKYVHEFTKMTALASLPALVAAQWCSTLTSVTIGVALLYLLLVRVG